MGRCWPNYKPAPGKTAYSKGSCIPRQTSGGFKMRGPVMYSYGDSANSTTNVQPKQNENLISALQNTDVRSFEDLIPGMAEYNEHQANIPQFKEGDTFGGHFNTYMKRVIHNMTGPRNPNLMGGGGGLDLVGGKGFIKGAGLLKNAFKHVLKSGAKTGAKKINS